MKLITLGTTMMKKFKFIFISVIVLTLLNCNKSNTVDLSSLQTYHHVAIPLVSAEIDIQDMLERDTGGVVSTGNQGELFLAYTTPPMSMSASEVITLSDQSFDIDIPLGSLSGVPAGIPFTGTVTVQDTSSYDFMFPNGEELTSIDFSSGLLTISVDNSLSHEVSMTFTIPSLLDGASPFTDVLVVPANNTAITQVNLSSYDLDFTQGNVGFNEFIVQTEATITGSGAPISSTDNLTMSFGMSSMNFNQINGDLKYQHFDLGTEETVFDIFQSSFGALSFQLTNPEIRLDITNSFGFDVYMGMDSMYYEDLSGNFIDHILYDSTAQGNLQQAPFYFPVVNQPSTPGGTSSNSIVMNASNSSIDELINATPKQMIFSSSASINLDTNITNSNYVLSNSEISVSSEILLPLEGYAGGWALGDTLPFDFTVDSLFSSNTTIEESVIKFVTTNGWPVEVEFTLELLDGSENLLTSIANQEMIIESGMLDANGRVETPTIKLTELNCDSTCVNNLNLTRYVVLNVSANTDNFSNQQSVKIYNDYTLGIEMAIMVAGRIF